MLLSELLGKPIFIANSSRGICLGIGISLKNGNVKYLLCASSPSLSRPDYCLNFNAVTQIDNAIHFPRLRPVLPKNCAQLTANLPVFTHNGSTAGKLLDVEIRQLSATRFKTDFGIIHPVSAIAACADAILLRKPAPYPIGQAIPIAGLPFLADKTAHTVTKPVLRAAIEKKSLVKLTLSLSPFSLDFHTAEHR